jgi:ATP-dependent DNA helicase RecG
MDFSKIRTLEEAIPRVGSPAEEGLFALIVSEIPVVVPEPKRRVVLSATDGMLATKIVVFDDPGRDLAYWRGLRIGDRINVRSILQSRNGTLLFTSPERVPDNLVGSVFPRYPSRRGVVSENALYDATRHALRHHINDTVQSVLRSLSPMDEAQVCANARLRYSSLTNLLHDLHAPSTIDAAEIATAEVRKLAAYSVVINARRMKRSSPISDAALRVTSAAVDRLIAALPIKLTADQTQGISEICEDLARPFPMFRLLSGDVGTGKTITYVVPAVAARNAGHLVAVLTPNSVLADQLAGEIPEFLGHDVPVILVTGRSKGKLDLSANPIVIGTTALLSKLKAQNASLALLVVDEQQKFSVSQKQTVVEAATNLLEVTATAIPRTTALVTHAGMDISILQQCPVTKNIQTRIVSAGDAERLFSHTLKVVAAGAQVAVVYPLVNDPEQEKRSVMRAYETWARRFPGKVGVIYGAMREEEKNEVIRKLKARELSVLVSSTAIEIGVTIPALKSLVVVNADRYGVSTLHQLRGRVARHGGTGYFFVYLPDKVKPETMARLQLLERFTDGFSLAENDAEMRGYGDLTKEGARQHGASRSSIFFGIELIPADIHQHSETVVNLPISA